MSAGLVAAPADTSTPFSGAFLIEDGQALADAVQSGSWIEGGVAAFSGVVDTAAAVIDPIGTLLANGLGWVLDHVDPLRGWLDDFTGDPGEVEAFAQTWENIATRMRESGDALWRRADDVADMSGEAIDAYLAYAADASRHLSAVGDWAAAIGTGMRVASQLVQVVHDLVRDAVSQLVGTAISVAAETALTLGIAAPFAIGQITARVAVLSKTVGRAIVKLQRGLQALIRLIDQLKGLLTRGSSLISRMLRGDASATQVGLPGTSRVEPVYQEGWVRRSTHERVYRSDDRPTAEIFEHGFVPRDPDNHDFHAFVRSNVPSDFVSTTTDPEFYRYWGSDYRYVIAHDGGIDANATFPGNPFADEAEIAFPGGVPASSIIGAHRVTPSGDLGDWIPNPHFMADRTVAEYGVVPELRQLRRGTDGCDE